MKKLFYLIVALMLVPALVACGATAAGQPSEQPSEPPCRSHSVARRRDG